MIKETDRGVLLSLFVQPRASKNEIVGLHNGALKIRVTAAPVDGKANEGIIEFLAKIFGIPKRQVEILKGETGRNKTALLIGISKADVQNILKIDPI